MKNFSIIIPHKNIPNLLVRCLRSIPSREDLEIIVVDDNSDNKIVDFERFPGMERSDVKVLFSKDGKGGGHARNIGLKEAIGKWILFADADDFFNECLNDVMDEYKESDAELIFFNANSVDTDTLEQANRAIHVNRFIDQYENGNREKAILQLKYLFGEPWSKITKKEIIDKNHIRFDETLIHNDTTFAYLIGFHANKILVDKRALYCITAREGSVSKTLDSNRILTRICVFGRSNKFLRDHGIPVRWEILYSQMAYLFINDKILYQQSMKILKQSEVDMKDLQTRIKRKLPKQFMKYIIYRFMNKKTY